MYALKSLLTTTDIDRLPTTVGGKVKFPHIGKLHGSGFTWDPETRTLQVTKLPYRVNLGLSGVYINTWEAGSKTWTHWYRVLGRKPRQPKTGERPINTADEQWDKAIDWKRIIKAGGDPYQMELDQRAKAQQALLETCASLVPVFLEKHKSRNGEFRTKRECQRSLELHFLPKFGPRPVKEVRRTEIIDLLDNIEEHVGPASAAVVFAWVRLFFNWCEDRELVDRNPCIRVQPPKVASRDRVFDDREYKALWDASKQLTTIKRVFFRSLLLLGQRRGRETSQMRWDEIDGSAWLIPSQRMKNNKPHLVMLPPAAAVMLKEIRVKGCPWVFPSYDGTKPFCDYSNLKRQLVAALAIDGITMKPWRLHDARRSFRTTLPKLGIDESLAERIISHTPGGVEGVYNRYAYMDEKAAAMRKFQVWLAGVTGDPELKLGPVLISDNAQVKIEA